MLFVGLIAVAGIFLTFNWLRRRHARRARYICDVCFDRVDPGAEMCPHCGTVFGDPNREYHEAVPKIWVAAHVARLRAMAYEELLALRDVEQHFEVPLHDGDLLVSGEVKVRWDDPPRRAGALRVTVTMWNARREKPLASDHFVRVPDGSSVGV